MSKSRKFEDILDECLERLLDKNQTIEQCLQSFPKYSDRLKPLLEMALTTRRVSAVQPRAEFRERAREQFRERARQQFKSALQETGRKKSPVSFHWGWQRGWATAVAIVLVLSLAGGGTVAAASGSMPDSPLYTVKTATEQVQMAFTFSELGKAELHAKLANKRVTEIIYLAEADKPEEMVMTTQNMNTHLTEITALVSVPEAASGIAVAPAVEQAVAASEAPVPKQVTTAEEAPAPKQAAVSQETPAPPAAPTIKNAPAAQTIPAPPQAAAAVQRAPGTKSEEELATKPREEQAEDKQASKVTSAPGESEKKGKEASSKTDQRAKLKTTVESHANSNIARLRASLETAPESAKPALQLALNQSETEYKKAIEALK